MVIAANDDGTTADPDLVAGDDWAARMAGESHREAG